MTTESPLHLQFEKFAMEQKADEERIYNRCAASLYWLDEYVGVHEWAYPDWTADDPAPDYFNDPDTISTVCKSLQQGELNVSQIRAILTTVTAEDAEKVCYAVELDAGLCLAAEMHINHSSEEDPDIGEVIDGLRAMSDECEDCSVVLGWLALSHVTHGETMSTGLLNELAHNLSPQARADFRHHLVVSLDSAYERALLKEKDRASK